MSPADDVTRAPSSARLRIRPPVRPWRLVVGLVLVLGATLSCWALMVRASERRDVLVLSAEVAAGDVLTAEHLGVVAIGSGDDIPTIPAGRLGEMVGQYARYRLAAGALLVPDNLQAAPLVTPGRALVSVVADSGDVPAEVTVGDDVVLILVDTQSCGPSSASIIDAAVTSAPHRAPGSSAGGSGAIAVSLEVDDDAVAAVALADRVVIARPNSPEADAAVTAAARASAACDEAGSITWPSAADPAAGGPGATDDPTVQQPVPTGVTPLDPDDVLIDAGS